jgi:hypothetical protein
MNFNWSSASDVLETFGGVEQTLHIPKTGLPFFDVLRLYGAIELYIGLRDEITINDKGHEWSVESKVRPNEVPHQAHRAKQAVQSLKKAGLTKNDLVWIEQMPVCLKSGHLPTNSRPQGVSSPLNNPDSALKDGVRDTAATTYKGLETGFGKASKISWADALFAYAGQKRTETVAGLFFLPVFEGTVDFSKVVSPLRAWIGIPNVLCAQALTLLALKTSLFAEGYADRLHSVVYNMDKEERKGFYNYSGQINIRSTALNRQRFANSDPERFEHFVSHFYSTFRSLVGRAWDKGKSTDEVEDALAHAYWLMQPSSPKHLSALLTSIEKQKRDNKPTVLIAARPRKESFVQEMFDMTYGKWQGDNRQEAHETLRRFASAVASGIYYARQAEAPREEQGKIWYDEATMLRSAPSAKAFFERAMILIELGKRKNNAIGTSIWGQDSDPERLFASIGETRADFETFRDLFRMYLVQESKPFQTEQKEPLDTATTIAEANIIEDIEGDEE